METALCYYDYNKSGYVIIILNNKGKEFNLRKKPFFTEREAWGYWNNKINHIHHNHSKRMRSKKRKKILKNLIQQ